MNDTEKCPDGGPAGGSRSQGVIGRAAIAAAENLLSAMRKDNGFMTYEEMKAAGREMRYSGSWSAPAANCDENGQGNPFALYMYAVFMSEVAVEVATGKTEVERMVMVADPGVVNNRLVVDGQNYGGLAQGVGLALSEDYEDIQKHSTLIGAGFPYIKQIPDDIELMYVESPRPEGPFGASGVGELPLTSPHASIINAIANACGARVHELPARPEKVLAAMPK
jgi:aldehyde oxidoreductase